MSLSSVISNTVIKLWLSATIVLLSSDKLSLPVLLFKPISTIIIKYQKMVVCVYICPVLHMWSLECTSCRGAGRCATIKLLPQLLITTCLIYKSILSLHTAIVYLIANDWMCIHGTRSYQYSEKTQARVHHNRTNPRLTVGCGIQLWEERQQLKHKIILYDALTIDEVV